VYFEVIDGKYINVIDGMDEMVNRIYGVRWYDFLEILNRPEWYSE